MTDLTTRFATWMQENDDPGDPATPAATVVVLRDSPDGPEVLMVQRNARGTFASNWVFPGGKVDPEDWSTDPADPIKASRVAASREALEECDVTIDASSLHAFSHWMPPREVPRRFATWFFVGRSPVGADGEVHIDGGEIVDHLWVRPADALAKHAAGKVELVPPTWITLNELRTATSVDTALHAVQAAQTRFYVTRMIPGEPRTVVWHEDAAHATGDLTTPGGRHRLTLHPTGPSAEHPNGWVFEQS